jgi:hypothetical protein
MSKCNVNTARKACMRKSVHLAHYHSAQTVCKPEDAHSFQLVHVHCLYTRVYKQCTSWKLYNYYVHLLACTLCVHYDNACTNCTLLRMQAFFAVQFNVNELKPGFTTTPICSKCLILAPPCEFGANTAKPE